MSLSEKLEDIATLFKYMNTLFAAFNQIKGVGSSMSFRLILLPYSCSLGHNAAVYCTSDLLYLFSVSLYSLECIIILDGFNQIQATNRFCYCEYHACFSQILKYCWKPTCYSYLLNDIK